MVGALAERSTAALLAAGSSPARNNYLYDLHLVVSDCLCLEFVCLNTHTPRLMNNY